MFRPALPIEHYMSSVLVVVGPKQPIAEASRLMRLHEIRHLPVVDRGRTVGVISQRDVYLLETLEDVDPARVLVEEAMTREMYTVVPDERVDVVAREMADRKIGSAVVARGEQLLGLFTTTDALRALAALVIAAEVEATAERHEDHGAARTRHG
jgi:acetoin utilization protein AcuB